MTMLLDNHKNLIAKGFTLIELAVVIAVLAILAAVAIPRMINTTLEAERTNAKEFRRHLISARGLYAAEQNTVPTQFTQYVTTGPVTDPFILSTENFAGGTCTVSPTAISCGADDFPALTAEIGGNLVFNMSAEGDLTDNIP